MTKKTIYNPLTDVVQPQVAVANADQPPMEATAAIYNEKVGQCPKCQTSMTSGTIGNGDTVFFCPTCRVSTPQQN